jgi:hypothetical protein
MIIAQTTPQELPENRQGYDRALQLVSSGVWTVDPTTGVIRNAKGRKLGHVNADGYREIGVRTTTSSKDPKFTAYAHRIICEAAWGPIPPGLTVDHLNGRKDDNRLSNLDLVTLSENVKRAYANGQIRNKGCDHGSASLTPALLAHLRAVGLPSGLGNARLAPFYGVKPSVISSVRRGVRYAHAA